MPPESGRSHLQVTSEAMYVEKLVTWMSAPDCGDGMQGNASTSTILYKLRASASFALTRSTSSFHSKSPRRVPRIIHDMRFHLIVAALSGIAAAIPLGADSPTPVAQAVGPRQTINPEYVSVLTKSLMVHFVYPIAQFTS